MKNEKRGELRVLLANFVIIAARDPHEPDSMLAFVEYLEEWIDDLADNRTSRALGAVMHVPTDEEIRHFNLKNNYLKWTIGGSPKDEKN